jgi:DNA modification methylase
MDYNSFYQFLYDAFSNLKEFTKNKSAMYIFYTHSQTRAFINALYDVGLKQRAIIIWHKTGGGFGDFMAQYMNAYEPCIYASNGETVNWYGPTDEKTVWDMDKEKKCDLHPTMKPVALVERALKNSSRGGQLVLDLFGGSGTTLMASEKNGRRSRLMELDPKYCDVIRRRYTQWAKENGKPITSGCLE